MIQFTFAQYQTLAARTARHGAPDRLAVDFAGLVAEVGEIGDEIQHAAEQERSINVAHLAEELGDVLWRVADICTACDLLLATVATNNIAKLEARHPHGFSAATSIARHGSNGQKEGGT